MSKRKKPAGPRSPAIRVHRRSQRAYVTLSGQTYWLGAATDPARFATFAEVVRDWEARGRQPVPDDDTGDEFTVGALVRRYRAHRIAERGAEWMEPTGSGGRVHYALEALERLYGSEAASTFGPRALKGLRAAMIAGEHVADDGSRKRRRVCRREANARVREIQRAFRWAASEELIAAATSHAIACVEPLADGDQSAHDNPARGAADPAAVAATLPFLPAVPRRIVQLLQLTGARPSEVMRLRAGDIDTSDPHQWVALLGEHKTARHGKARVLVFEREAIEVLRPMLNRPAGAYLFRPADSDRESRQRVSAEFARQRGESPTDREFGDGGRQFRPHYDATALRLAISRAITAANRDRASRRLPPIPVWTPYGLRHLRATEVALIAGESDATTLLGHAGAAVTKRYLHSEVERARRASRRVLELQQRSNGDAASA